MVTNLIENLRELNETKYVKTLKWGCNKLPLPFSLQKHKITIRQAHSIWNQNLGVIGKPFHTNDNIYFPQPLRHFRI
jgi:hypothetical protein